MPLLFLIFGLGDEMRDEIIQKVAGKQSVKRALCVHYTLDCITPAVGQAGLMDIQSL